MPGRARRAPLLPLALAALCLVGSAACDRSEDLREWRPDDHDRADDPRSGARAPGAAAPSGRAGTKPPGDDTAVIDVLWQSQCASCHGMSGRGDGPMGSMVHATDLTRADWQGKTSDQDIAKVIVEGRGRMPKFEAMAPEIVNALVKRIRTLRAR